MNVFAKFVEIPPMILQDIKETKRYGHTDGHSFGQTVVKTVYPPTKLYPPTNTRGIITSQTVNMQINICVFYSSY